MVSKGPGRQGARWHEARTRCLLEGEVNRTPCYFCHLPIDYELTRWNYRHRSAGTVHHVVGLAQGGDPVDPANLAVAHRSCNCRDGALKLLQTKRQRIGSARDRNSRRW